jgi:hypothetical protein
MTFLNTLGRYRSASIALALLLLVAAPAAAGQAPADEPLTRAEILTSLRSIPKSSTPSAAIKEAHDRLAALIKQRGVDFVQPRGKFDREFYEAGITSETSVAIWENYRAPGTASPGAGAEDMAFFAKRWAMGIAGMTTRFDRQGSAVMRSDQLVGAAGGYLDIAADGTYAWRYDASSPEMRGRWRAATAQERQTEAGQGLVLLRGYDDGDWLVTRRPSEEPGEYVNVRHVSARYRYFIGSRPAAAPTNAAAPLDAHVEEVLQESGLPFEKTGESWRVLINGKVLRGFPVVLSVVGNNLLARSTHRPSVSVSREQVASLQAVQRDPVTVAFLRGEVVAYAGEAIDALDVTRLRRLIAGVARAVDDAAALLTPAPEANPLPADAPPVGPRLGRYQLLSYGNPANPLRVGHIELVAGGTYRYHNADGRLLGAGTYAFDAAKSAIIWKDGLLNEQNWTGAFTIERQGKTHKIRLRGATIAVNNID